MGLLDDLKGRVARLDPRVRTALLAACAERVLPVYEGYWVGDHSDAPARAAEIGWASALGGLIDGAGLRACRDELQDLVTYYYEEATRHELLAHAVTVGLRSLQSLGVSEEESLLATARGLLSTIEVAKDAEWMANWDAPEADRTKLARDEEYAWQEVALSRAETWPGPVARTMFADLGPNPPAWLADWLVRTAHLR